MERRASSRLAKKPKKDFSGTYTGIYVVFLNASWITGFSTLKILPYSHLSFAEFAEGASDDEKVKNASGSEAELSDGSEEAPKKVKRTKSAGSATRGAPRKQKSTGAAKKKASKDSEDSEGGDD